MMDSRTGELTMLNLDDLRAKEPPAGTVILHGAEDDIRRVADVVKRSHADEKAKAKRKAQRAARKRNR